MLRELHRRRVELILYENTFICEDDYSYNLFSVINYEKPFQLVYLFIHLIACIECYGQTSQIDDQPIKDWLILEPITGNNLEYDYLSEYGGGGNIIPQVVNELVPKKVRKSLGKTIVYISLWWQK